MFTLTVTKRDITQDLAKLRKDGFIPAVFYGRKESSTPISVKAVDFLKVWKAAGESSIISLDLAGETHDALIHEVSTDAIRSDVVHIDFYVIEKGKKVEVNIPLNFIGVSAAAKELGGTLVKVMHDLPIEAEAKNLPHEIEVDISSLVDFTSRIFAKDIKLPVGVTLTGSPEEIVALVNAAKDEPVEEAAPVDLANIELSEAKGKKEEEGAAAEPAAK